MATLCYSRGFFDFQEMAAHPVLKMGHSSVGGSPYAIVMALKVFDGQPPVEPARLKKDYNALEAYSEEQLKAELEGITEIPSGQLFEMAGVAAVKEPLIFALHSAIVEANSSGRPIWLQLQDPMCDNEGGTVGLQPRSSGSKMCIGAGGPQLCGAASPVTVAESLYTLALLYRC